LLKEGKGTGSWRSRKNLDKQNRGKENRFETVINSGETSKKPSEEEGPRPIEESLSVIQQKRKGIKKPPKGRFMPNRGGRRGISTKRGQGGSLIRAALLATKQKRMVSKSWIVPGGAEGKEERLAMLPRK